MWGRQKSKTGIYGDPTVATKETGRKIFEVILDTYVSFLKEYYQSEPSGKNKTREQFGRMTVCKWGRCYEDL